MKCGYAGFRAPEGRQKYTLFRPYGAFESEAIVPHRADALCYTLSSLRDCRLRARGGLRPSETSFSNVLFLRRMWW